MTTTPRNVDAQVAEGFGDEWSRFDQAELAPADKQRIFDEYFHIFPWHTLPPNASGADFGCGSGRWASLVAPRVGHLNCIDASIQALNVARRNLASFSNCDFIEASVGELPLKDESLDFAYSLGVLHHVPDTAAGIASCVSKLKRGAPMLLYLYYRFDNRALWYRAVWGASDLARRAISRLPHGPRYVVSQIIAATVYWPLARFALLIERCGVSVSGLPLAYYRDRDYYVMRTDALDRFGTRLEQRFTKAEIHQMMRAAGLGQITFSDRPPYWCAVGFRN